MTEPHAWETRQFERARVAAADTAHRLERALAEMESELDFRRVELGQIVAERHDRGARLFEAHQAGARLVFGGSMAPNTAEAAWDGVPASAVRVLAEHIVAAPRLDAEESAALGAVGDLERRVLQAQRALAHWQAVAGTGSPSSGSPSSGSPSSDSPASVRAPAGPPAPEAATAKAAVMTEPIAQSAASPPPATGSASIRDRLAGLADRVAGW